MTELLKLQTITSDRDLKGLRMFYDTLEGHIQSLVSLDVDSSSYGALLAPIVMERLPHQVRLILTRDLKDKGWDLTLLQTALKTELLAREACSSSEEMSNHNHDSNRQTSGSALFANRNENKVICAFCKGRHYSDKCSIITDVSQRNYLLRKAGKCFKCLRSGHLQRKCSSAKLCFYCKGDHNSALCENREFENTKETRNLLVKSSTSVLLQTAVVNVSNKNKQSVLARVVFDSGSERSYISERV